VPGWLCAHWLPIHARRTIDERALRVAHATKRNARRAKLLHIKATAPKKEGKEDTEVGIEAELLQLNSPLDAEDAENGLQVMLCAWSCAFQPDTDIGKAATPYSLTALYATLPALTSDDIGFGSTAGDAFELARIVVSTAVLDLGRAAWSELRHALMQQAIIAAASNGEAITQALSERFHRLLSSTFCALQYDTFVCDEQLSNFLNATKEDLAVRAASADSPPLPAETVAALPMELRLILGISCTLKRVEVMEALFNAESGAVAVDGALSMFWRFSSRRAQALIVPA
jgi:hypothetical protein